MRRFSGWSLDRYDALIAGTLIGLAGLLLASNVGPKRLGDGHFHREAAALAAAIKSFDFSLAIPFEHSPAAPLYYLPPYLAVPVAAPDRTFWIAAVVWNVTWTAIALMLMRRAAERIAGSRAGWYAAAGALLCPMAAYYSLGVLSETPAYAAVAVLVFAWARWLSAPAGARRPLVWVAVALLLIAAIRPNAILIIAATALAAVALWLRGRELRSRAKHLILASAVAGACAFGVIIATQSWNNRAGNSGQQGFLTHVLIQGAFQFRHEPWDWRHWDDDIRADSVDYAEYAKVRSQLDTEASRRKADVGILEREWLRHSISHEPLVWLRMSAMRALAGHVFLMNSRPPDKFALAGLRGRKAFLLFHAALNAAQIALVAGALVFLWQRRGDLPYYWGLWGPWVGLTVFTAATYCEPRYLFPAQPALAVMAGAALARRTLQTAPLSDAGTANTRLYQPARP